jgi:hypothetical protein
MNLDIVNLADIGVVQRRNGSRFLLEALAVLLFDLLDGHNAAQAHAPCLPHFSHAIGADGGEDSVRAEFGPRGKCHSLAKNDVKVQIYWTDISLKPGSRYSRVVHYPVSIYGLKVQAPDHLALFRRISPVWPIIS